jgi:hypothetical protein
MAAINFPPRTQGVPDLTLVTLGDLSTEYYWTGEQWLSVGLGGGGASVTIQSTPPTSPEAGDLWFDNDSGILSMYYDSTWVDVGGGDSGTSAGSVNGIVKADGAGNFSAAVAGTDYLTSATLSSSPAGVKAWVNFDGTTSGTWAGGASTVTRVAGSTTATVTTTNAHGLTTGNIVYVLTGVVAGSYTVTVLASNTFTITTVATTALNAVAITFRGSTIHSSYNVSSITKNGIGDYTVNFTTPMGDVNYAVNFGTVAYSATQPGNVAVIAGTSGGGATLKTTSALQINTGTGGNGAEEDLANVSVTIFGN